MTNRLHLSEDGDIRHAKKDWDPNELLIQLMCSAIRMTWSQEERERRTQITACRAEYGRPIAIRLSQS